MADREEDEFSTLMRQAGVAPIDRPAAAMAWPERASPPQAPRGGDGARAAQTGPATDGGALRQQLTALRQEHAQLQQQNARLQQEHARLQQEHARQQQDHARQGQQLQELVAWHKTRDRLDGELATLRATVEALDHERRGAARRQGELERSVAALRRQIEAADKRAVLSARGLATEAERADALACLLAAAPGATVAALCAPDPAPLAALIERMVRCCDDPGCQPSGDAPRLRVAKASCEVCGGSDVQRAFVAFATACHGAGFDRVTIVGGSPAYREALRGLSRSVGGGLQLRVVQNERPGEGKRAQAVRGLVVIWGATAVDHTTTGHYRGAGDAQIAVNHRGVAGMLAQVGERLAAGLRG